MLIITMPKMNVNGIAMTGIEYKEHLIKNIITQKWQHQLLTVIANMFRFDNALKSISIFFIC